MRINGMQSNNTSFGNLREPSKFVNICMYRVSEFPDRKASAAINNFRNALAKVGEEQQGIKPDIAIGVHVNSDKTTSIGICEIGEDNKVKIFHRALTVKNIFKEKPHRVFDAVTSKLMEVSSNLKHGLEDIIF